MEQQNRTRRTRSFKLTASDEELEAIRETARAAGLSTAGYLRAAGLRLKIKAAPARIPVPVQQALSRMAANLNQVAHAGHLGHVDPAAVDALRTEVRALVAAIAQAGNNSNTN